LLPLHISKNYTVFNYEDIPAGYYYEAMLHGSGIQRFWHQKKFAEVSKHIKNSETVLDLGCGPGSFLSILGKMYPDVVATGVDIAQGQIDFANSNVGSSFKDHRISFKLMDEKDSKTPFEAQTFDVVTSIEVIEHIHPFLASKLLQEGRRVLKPNGKLILTTPNYRSFWPLIELVLERFSKVKYHDQHINKFTPNSFVKFVESAGFKVEKVSTLFMIAPFLVPLIGEKLAAKVLEFEKRLPGRFGSLLIVEATPLSL
jgi:SAM-dependent methyltransferase